MDEKSKLAIEQILAQTNFEIPIFSFTLNLLLAGFLSYILYLSYVRFGYSLSNRKSFGRNFILIAMTTMVIIAIVKSSLALSLGLVGALSIVRFRAAIKEPEELGYLFLSITIGLGLGANQVFITIIGFIIILGAIIIRNISAKKSSNEMNMFITVSSPDPDNTDINQVISILENGSIALDLKRLDVKSDILEASFLIEFDNNNQLNLIVEDIKKYNSKIGINFIDNQGVF